MSIKNVSILNIDEVFRLYKIASKYQNSENKRRSTNSVISKIGFKTRLGLSSI